MDRRHLWLVFSIIGVVGSGGVWIFMPHDWEITSIWQPVVKVAVFGCLCLAVALVPNAFRQRHLVAMAPFVFLLAYVLPRVSFFVFHDVPPYSPLAREGYTVLYLLLYPTIVLGAGLAYRMGGGSPGAVLKICLTGVLLIFSGFLDVMWPLANGQPLPKVIEAHHIKILIGHFPSYAEAVWFSLAHLPLLVLLNVLPFDRWLARLGGSAQTRSDAPAAGSAAGQSPC